MKRRREERPKANPEDTREDVRVNRNDRGYQGHC